MSYLAATLTMLGLVLNARHNIACWAIWLASNAVWITYLTPKGEYALVMQNIVFVGLNIYGWRQWRQQRKAA